MTFPKLCYRVSAIKIHLKIIYRFHEDCDWYYINIASSPLPHSALGVTSFRVHLPSQISRCIPVNNYS